MDQWQYRRAYDVLGVKADATWQEIRQAYRRGAQQTHPDKARGHAEHRVGFSEVSKSYQLLKEYRDRFGRLPDVRPSRATQKPAPAKPDPTPGTAPARQPQATGTNWRVPLMFFLALAPLYWILQSPSSDPPLPKSNATPLPDVSIDDYKWLVPGMTMGEVLDSRGPPLENNGNIWIYPDVSIFLDNGKVADWVLLGTDRSPQSRARPEGRNAGEPDLVSADKPAFIKVGITKNQVLRIQGAPLRKNETTWDYRVSKIYFKDGKVVDWYNSPLDALKLEK